MAFAPVFGRPFAPTFGRHAAAGNGLLNALIAYWPGNEASGNLLDAHTNALHLTDTNTVTSAAGKVYATARQYTSETAEYHTRADDTYLSTGDVDFTVVAWVYLDKTYNHSIVGRWTISGNQREYYLFYNNDDSLPNKRFRFVVSPDGTAGFLAADATTFGEPSTKTWYLVIGWHDAANNQIGISVNDGTPDIVAHSTGVFNSNSTTDIGRLPFISSYYMSGRIGPRGVLEIRSRRRRRADGSATRRALERRGRPGLRRIHDIDRRKTQWHRHASTTR